MSARRPATKDSRLASRSIHIPKDARCILEHENGSALYVFDSTRGKPSLVSFWRTSGRPLNYYSYSSEDARHAAVLAFKHAVESDVQRRHDASARRKAWRNPLKTGTILYTSWGYDQTNVDFFVVTRVSGKRVHVRRIASDFEATGFMSGRAWPKMPIEMIGDETWHIAQPNGDSGVYLNIGGHSAWVEDGRAHYSSSYA